MGVITEYMEQVKPALLAYGRDLGGDPDTVSDLPFSEEADKDGMPEELYVRHDQAIIHETATSLMNDQHVGVISPYGTGKTALREIVRRDLGNHPNFILAYLENADNTTPRQLYELAGRAALADGYSLDADEFSQMRDGLPWATDELKRGVRQLVERADADGRTVVLLVDEIEDFPADLLPTLQTAGDVGVRLFLLGTPTGKDRLEDLRDTLNSRVKWQDGIKPFEPDDVAEYIARSLAYYRGDEYDDGYPIEPFTDDAVQAIHQRTDGNPRDVRLECSDALAKGAIYWAQRGKNDDFEINRNIVTASIKN